MTGAQRRDKSPIVVGKWYTYAGPIEWLYGRKCQAIPTYNSENVPEGLAKVLIANVVATVKPSSLLPYTTELSGW